MPFNRFEEKGGTKQWMKIKREQHVKNAVEYIQIVVIVWPCRG
jgi:hypothetical protein